MAKKGRDEVGMSMRLIALVIAAAVMSLGSLTSCGEAPSTTEVGPSSPVIRVVETIGVTDSPQTSPSAVIRVEETIGITDSPQTSPSEVIRVAETIGVADSPQTSPSEVIRIVETIGVTDSPTLTPTPAQPLPPPEKVTVAVTSPKVGTVWRVGTAQNIAWATTGEGIAYVDIYYSTDGGKSMISIAKTEPDDGIYTWKVPNTPSKTVLVRVLAFGAKGETLALGDSGLFTVESVPLPTKVTVAVTSPKAGGVWRVGTAQNIAWATTGEGIAYISIYYSTDGGKSMISIARKEPNDGIYTWKVPNTPSKTVLVRVLAFNVKGETLALGNSGLFTISIQ